MLRTSVSALALSPLNEGHARALYELVQENRSHLTAYGDYRDLEAISLQALEAQLAEGAGCNLQFGIFLHQELIGRVDLVPVAPPRYGLGYWLAQRWTGKGYATAALKALLEFAGTDLQATDIYAGVTHGNWRSAAVLERAGFLPAEVFETYTRFHRALTGHSVGIH
ncbi:MAG: N-acetyltransferase [Alphaproteobacteria bacterium]|nr:MAG: N-acetyltransferase [Alphaproteobacteria bacterium]